MAHIQTGRSGEEEASPLPVQSSTTRLRGLPYSATEEDLIYFFEDFDIKSTHICKRSGALRPRRPCAACPVAAFALQLKSHTPLWRPAPSFECAQGARAARHMCNSLQSRRRSGRSRRRIASTWASAILSAPWRLAVVAEQGSCDRGMWLVASCIKNLGTWLTAAPRELQGRCVGAV